MLYSTRQRGQKRPEMDTQSSNPWSPRNTFIVQVGSYCCVWSGCMCAQPQTRPRKDTNYRQDTEGSLLCALPRNSAWLGQVRVLCKARARGLHLLQKASNLFLLLILAAEPSAESVPRLSLLPQDGSWEETLEGSLVPTHRTATLGE